MKNGRTLTSIVGTKGFRTVSGNLRNESTTTFGKIHTKSFRKCSRSVFGSLWGTFAVIQAISYLRHFKDAFKETPK